MRTCFILMALILFSQSSLAAQKSSVKKIKVKNVSDLSKLAPFDDVSIIQKRYLPKTFRFESGLSLIGILNNAFFYSGGVFGHLGFFLRERFGLGLEGYYLGRLEKLVSKDLNEGPNKIVAFTDYKTKFYAGGYFKWSPFYGKFAFLEKRTLYFDFFLVLGGGVASIEKGISEEKKRKIKITDNGSEELHDLIPQIVPALYLGFGQTFALGKNSSFTWDIKSFFRKQEACAIPMCFSDISFSLGMNAYFPGAKYR